MSDIPRFQPPDKPPIEDGECVACGEVMYQGQTYYCKQCGRVHDSCQADCSVCGKTGCKKCNPVDEFLEPICEDCKNKREAD